jgi:hypothetical protein
MWIVSFMLQTTFGSIVLGRRSLLGSASSGTRYLFSSLRLYQPHGSSKFRLYVGLLVNPNVYRKPSKEGEADDDDDDDDDGPTDIQTNTKDTSGLVLPSDDPARSAYSVELDDHDDDEGTMQARKSDLEEQREEKLIVFLNDPEKSVTIFLSSHMREQGLIWSVS